MTADTLNLATAFRFARRELRGGLKGFRVFVACLALGVGAIAAVGSLSSMLQDGLASQASAILGGDAEVSLTQRDIDEEELAWLETQGTVSQTRESRVMARGLESDIRSLVEVKAVDENYPLYGEVELSGGLSLLDATKKVGDVWGAAVEAKVLPRLGIAPGDLVRIGDINVELRATIEVEPDRVSTGFLFAPRVFIAPEALDQSGLVQVGSQVQNKYRIKLPEGVDTSLWMEAAKANLKPDAAERLRGPDDGTQGAEQFILRVSLFLSMVGLTTLIIGGLGVGNAIKSYLESKTETIATYKCLGATGTFIFQSFLMQVLIIASIGIALGLAIGMITPMLVIWFIGDLLPITAEISVYPLPLALAALNGLLVTLGFAIWPLARARDIEPAALFRDMVDGHRGRPSARYIFAVIAIFTLLAILAVFITPYRLFALIFLAGAITCFVLLRLEAYGLMRLAKAMGRPKNPGLRLALTNLYRPGATTTNVVLSVGLGLTLLVGVALIQGNISTQIQEELPAAAPSFFMLDIRRDQAEPFDELVNSIPGTKELQRQPWVRATISKIKGAEPDMESISPEARWVLQRERNVTYRSDKPDNRILIEGEWWPIDYNGPPQISLDNEVAQGLGVGLGDTMTFSIVGREIDAEIANLVDVDLTAGDTNFYVMFAPGALEEAPQQNVALVMAEPNSEEAIYKAVTDTFPNVTVVWIREALLALNGLLESIALAVQSTGAVTLLAGVLVMAGGLASGFRRRVYDAVILKVLGATRGKILASYFMEFAFLGLGTAVVAAIVGTLAGFLVVTVGMEATWYFLPLTLVGTVLAATAITILLGLLGTWRALAQKAAPVLRSE